MSTMTAADAAWFDMDRPTNPMVVTAVMWFDGPVDVDLVRGIVAERLVARFTRFRQRVVEHPVTRRHRWEEDPHFDVDRHVHHRHLPRPGDRAALHAVVSELVSEQLPRDRPLWQLWALEGEQTSAVVTRLHHCLADGQALAYVLAALTDDIDVTVPPAPEPPEHVTIDLVRRTIDRARHPVSLAAQAPTVAREGASLARLVLLPPDHRTVLRGRLAGGKRVAWSEPTRLSEVSAVGHAFGGTVNDVLMSALTGAITRYLAARGPVPSELRALVPVDRRVADNPVDAALGNRFGMLIVPLPVGVTDPVERLADLVRRTARAKASPESLVASGVIATLGRVPRPAERALVDLFTAKASMLVTNVAGPQQPLSFAGRRLRGVVGWAPASGSVGLTVSIFSYVGEVVVGVAADAALVAHPEALLAAFDDELAALRAAADTVSAASR
jgi:diacylglycerol O-acyltransferase / wax synthase